MDYLKRFAKHKELLDKEYQWPAEYLFKFIVPAEKEKEVVALFPNNEAIIRPSSQGKYVSVTVTYLADSSDLVLAIYEQAASIEGLIAL